MGEIDNDGFVQSPQEMQESTQEIIPSSPDVFSPDTAVGPSLHAEIGVIKLLFGPKTENNSLIPNIFVVVVLTMTSES